MSPREQQARYERAQVELSHLARALRKADRNGPLPGMLEDRIAAKRREVEELAAGLPTPPLFPEDAQ